MKTFLNWVEEVDKDFSTWLEQSKLQEQGLRTGSRPGYPSGYARSQYPGEFFAPISATAILDKELSKQFKDKAPPDNAP